MKEGPTNTLIQQTVSQAQKEMKPVSFLFFLTEKHDLIQQKNSLSLGHFTNC